MNPMAVKAIKKNASLNRIKPNVIETSFQEFASKSKEKFDFIDIDPFGGLYPYVYDSMKIAKDKTYLMLTATDTAVLCGAHKDACIRLYGAIPLHTELCHEVGIRILLNYIVAIAAQFNFGIDVRIAVFQAHYFRVFIKLLHGNINALYSIRKCGYVAYCPACKWRYAYKSLQALQIKCKSCGGDTKLSGRMWLGNLYNKEDIESILKYFRNNISEKKEISIIEKIAGEYDTPLFYSIPALTKNQKIPSVSPAVLIGKLKAKGYVATPTHFDPGGIKTNAGLNIVAALAKAAVT